MVLRHLFAFPSLKCTCGVILISIKLISCTRGVDNFFEVGGLGVRVIPHATRGVWGHASPGNFWLFRAPRLLLVQSHWWKAS